MFPTVHGVVSQGGKGQAPTPSRYRYYRLHMTRAQPGGSIRIAALELRGSVGGTNLATGGTASAGGTAAGSSPDNAFDGNAATYWETPAFTSSLHGNLTAGSTFNGFPAMNAVDGNPSTYWASNSGVTATTLTWDVIGSLDVTKYTLRARPDAADGAPKDWTLEYSDDGSTWTVADTVTGETGWTNGEERAYTLASAGEHRYWRLNITANNGRSTINIAEWKLNDAQTLHAWLQYDLGSPADVAEYAIRVENFQNTPHTWRLLGSDDGVSWDELDSQTFNNWANGEIRAYPL